MTDYEESWVCCDTLFTPFRRHKNCAIHILDGKIEKIVSEGEIPRIPEDALFREPGTIVAPGFIDLHVHGAGGRDLMEAAPEALEALSETLARHGTTSFMATTVSASDAGTEAAVRSFTENRDRIRNGARPLGLHLEGPFLNPLRRGTQDPRYIRPADVGAFRRLADIAAGAVRRITLAPEMDPGFELIREACSRGIRVSLGHSDATEEQTRAAVAAGATQTTHTFNAMRPFHQREPGIIGAALTDDRLYTEVIVDGIHVHPTVLRLLVRQKSVDRMLLVTDGISATGMPDGRYPLGDRTVTVEHGVCRDEEGALAGSTLTLDRAIRNLVRWLELPLQYALVSACAAPARSMGISRERGIVAPGAAADLVFLDRDLHVKATMVAGRIVFRAAEEVPKG